jgi:hypothetical protein
MLENAEFKSNHFDIFEKNILNLFFDDKNKIGGSNVYLEQHNIFIIILIIIMLCFIVWIFYFNDWEITDGIIKNIVSKSNKIEDSNKYDNNNYYDIAIEYVVGSIRYNKIITKTGLYIKNKYPKLEKNSQIKIYYRKTEPNEIKLY